MGSLYNETALPEEKVAEIAPAQIASVAELFTRHLSERLRGKPDVVEKIGAVFQFDISGATGGQWVVDCHPPGGQVFAGRGEAPGCTVICSDVDLLALANGKLDGLSAFMSGRIQLLGDAGLAMKLRLLW